jgi:hypothetical protein
VGSVLQQDAAVHGLKMISRDQVAGVYGASCTESSMIAPSIDLDFVTARTFHFYKCRHETKQGRPS